MIHHNNPHDYYNPYNNHIDNSAVDNEMSSNTPFSVRDILNIVDQNEEMVYNTNQEYMQKSLCGNGYQYKRYALFN